MSLVPLEHAVEHAVTILSEPEDSEFVLRLEKDVDIVSGEETHLEKVIDIFYEFMQVYGFQKRSIINAMSEFIEYEKVELKE